jgi:hypothetical protein
MSHLLSPSINQRTATTVVSRDGDVIVVPEEFICPITLAVMNYPMVSRLGHTYERQAIVQWISSGNAFCPLTRTPLSYSDVIPHHPLHRQIVSWRARYNVDGPTTCATPMSATEDFVGILSLSSQQWELVIDEIHAKCVGGSNGPPLVDPPGMEKKSTWCNRFFQFSKSNPSTLSKAKPHHDVTSNTSPDQLRTENSTTTIFQTQPNQDGTSNYTSDQFKSIANKESSSTFVSQSKPHHDVTSNNTSSQLKSDANPGK